MKPVSVNALQRAGTALRTPFYSAICIQRHFRQYLRQFQKYDLLILDELLLVVASPSERNDLLELA